MAAATLRSVPARYCARVRRRAPHRVPAHAVERRDHRDIGADGNGNTILILFACADETELGIFDLQKPAPGSFG